MSNLPLLPHGYRWHVAEDYPRSITVTLLRVQAPHPIPVTQWTVKRSKWQGDWDRTAIARDVAGALVQFAEPKTPMADKAFMEGYTSGYEDGTAGVKPIVRAGKG